MTHAENEEALAKGLTDGASVPQKSCAATLRNISFNKHLIPLRILSAADWELDLFNELEHL